MLEEWPAKWRARSLLLGHFSHSLFLPTLKHRPGCSLFHCVSECFYPDQSLFSVAQWITEHCLWPFLHSLGLEVSTRFLLGFPSNFLSPSSVLTQASVWQQYISMHTKSWNILLDLYFNGLNFSSRVGSQQSWAQFREFPFISWPCTETTSLLPISPIRVVHLLKLMNLYWHTSLLSRVRCWY